jgi:anti-sigma factor (TIGR02949 family)
MACEEYQDQILLLQRGELEPGAAAALRAHLEACPSCRTTYDQEEALTAALGGATRHAAPEGLRRRVAESIREEAAGAGRGRARPPRAWVPRLWRPLVPAALGAAAAALISVPVTWYVAGRQPTPIVVLAQEVVHAHERVEHTLDWQKHRQDLEATLAYLSRWLDVEFPRPPVAAGSLKLVDARPTYFFERKAAAFTYEDERGRMVTLFAFRGGDIQLPERGRVQVERFKPYFAAAEKNTLCVWKQKEAGFSMVGRMSQEDLARAFLTVRQTL